MFDEDVGAQQTARGTKRTGEEQIRTCLLTEAEQDVFYLFFDKLRASAPGLSTLRVTDSPEEAELFIINARSEAWTWQTLRALCVQKEHFIKPALVVCETKWAWLSDAVDIVLDSPISRGSFAEYLGRLIQLHRRVQTLEELPRAQGATATKKLLLLRRLLSRDPSALTPRRNFRSKVGYDFIQAQLLTGAAAGEELAILESMHEAHLLNAKLVDKVNLCPRCDHTQINFRESCPKCGSLNIGDEPTIHHFRCAYVGRESEYKQGVKLICPKCSNELRHIGVDYDKPSEVMWCNDCEHNFSEPRLSCFCLVCAHEFSPEDADIRSIYEYSLSEAGYRAAEEGVLPGAGLISILKKELGFYKTEVFTEYLRIEIARCQRYKFPSTLARFKLSAAHDALEDQLTRKSRKFRKEFAEILIQTYRKSDMFTDLRKGDILIIFTNTDVDSSKIAFSRLSANIKERFEVDLELQYRLFDLRAVEDELDEIWESIQ